MGGTTHHLKTHPGPFQAVLDGLKTFEIRKDDRDYQVGDCLHLEEFDPVSQKFSGREMHLCVLYKLIGGQYGIESGYCAMSFTDVTIP